MLKRFAIALGILVASCMPVSAQFTEQEKLELKKLAQASYNLGTIQIRISGLRQFGGEPAVPLATHVKAFAPQAQLHKAIEECGAAQEFFAGVGTRHMAANLPRTAQVSGGFARIDQCVIRLQNALPALQTLAAADASQALNVTQVQAMIVGLPTIDRTLLYETPYVALDAPLVGTHGDMELALKRHASIHLYGTGVLGQLLVALQEVDGATSSGSTLTGANGSIYDDYYDTLDALGYMFRLHAATWLATLGVILDEERVVIEADQAAGSGIRGFDFFRLVRQSENMGATGAFRKKLIDPDGAGPLMGRDVVVGAGERLYLVQFGLMHMANTMMNDPTLNPDAGLTEAQLQARIVELKRRWAVLHNVFFAIDSVWVYVDAVRDSYFLFHHGIPTPPPPSGCVMPQVCMVPPPPCPTCPPEVTCGAGTHLEGNVCVADPAPACPDFSLVFIPGPGDKSGGVQCVEQP